MSRSELADTVNRYLLATTGQRYELDRHQIARYERGEVRWPGAAYRAGLREVLGAKADADLGFTPRRRRNTILACTGAPDSSASWHPADVVAAAEEMTGQDVTLSRRQALASGSAVAAGTALTDPLQSWLWPLRGTPRGGSVISETELSGWEQITAQLQGWSNNPTGLVPRKAVIAQLNDLSDRLRDAPDKPSTKYGFRIGAELAEIAASISWDARLHRAAQRYYTLSVQFAKIAGDNNFAARTLAAFARQCFDLGRPDDGLELVQLAQYGTRRTAGPAMRSMLATREAWSYAMRGQVQPFHRAIGLAEDHFAEAATGDGSDRLLTSFDEAELYGVIGARCRDLAQHDPSQARRAQEYISRALALRDPTRLRNRAFDLIGLARTHLLTSELDRACELVEQALPLAGQWSPGRVGQKLRDFYRESAPLAQSPTLRRTREEVRGLIEV